MHTAGNEKVKSAEWTTGSGKKEKNKEDTEDGDVL